MKSFVKRNIGGTPIKGHSPKDFRGGRKGLSYLQIVTGLTLLVM